MSKLHFIVLTGVVLLAGCGGIISDHGSQQPPTIEENNNTPVASESNESSLPEPGLDTSGDGITDRTAVQLGLDPETEYHDSFVSAIQIAQSKDPDNVDIVAERFAQNGTVNKGYYTTLNNYTTLAEEHPSAVADINTELLSEHSPAFIDKQLRALLLINSDVRTTVFESYDLGNDDWSTSGLKNWEEVKHGTDILAADTSGDGIPDGPSVHNREDYPNANPLQKDVYLEIVTSDGTEINQETLSQVQDVFADAPVDNPDGTEGINLHIFKTDGDPSSSDSFNDYSKYSEKGYHFAEVVPRNSLNDGRGDGDVRGIYNSRILLEDYNSNQKSSILMHELGHSLGLDPDLQGVDSRSVPFDEYESSMNYNSPRSFTGFSDGGDSTVGTNDWAHIECRMADRAHSYMIPYNENFNIPSEVYDSVRDETVPSHECVIGVDITSIEPNAIFIETDEYSNDLYNRTEIERTAAEQNISYEIINKSEVPESFEIEVDITNTADRRITEKVKLNSETKGKAKVSLNPGEQDTVTLQLDSDIVDLDQLGPMSESRIFEVKTTEDSVYVSVRLISSD